MAVYEIISDVHFPELHFLNVIMKQRQSKCKTHFDIFIVSFFFFFLFLFLDLKMKLRISAFHLLTDLYQHQIVTTNKKAISSFVGFNFVCIFCFIYRFVQLKIVSIFNTFICDLKIKMDFYSMHLATLHNLPHCTFFYRLFL